MEIKGNTQRIYPTPRTTEGEKKYKNRQRTMMAGSVFPLNRRGRQAAVFHCGSLVKRFRREGGGGISTVVSDG